MAVDPAVLLLYLVADRHLAGKRGVKATVEAALEGGVTIVQYRAKETSSREALKEGVVLRDLCRRAKVPFVVNDQVSLALALKADGVHLGQEDLPVAMAREILGPEAIIGLTVETVAQAAEESRSGADYLGASPVFFTPTKPEAGQGLGLDGLREVVEASRLPVVAIGGINLDNAREVIETGVSGAAVVSAIMAADDPKIAARRLHDILSAGRKKPWT